MVLPELDLYLNDLVADTGWKMTDLQREEYKGELLKQLDLRIGAMLLEELSPEKALEYLQLTKEGKMNAEKVLEFFENNVPDFNKKLPRILSDFRREFLASIS
ncbi:MAG TPA: hypothetical protein ENI70_01950 [Candidatus Peregrinibacteria bacterium]|nr:hypothetical protein [Candidatus Peregrinibacteria bacterium]